LTIYNKSRLLNDIVEKENDGIDEETIDSIDEETIDSIDEKSSKTKVINFVICFNYKIFK